MVDFDLSGIGSSALNIIVMVIWFLIIGGVLAGVTWYGMKRKRYGQYKCVIWELDGFGQPKETYDDAGVFVDKKTKNKRFFMRKANVGLEPDNVPAIGKRVYLLRTGLKNFKFIKPRIVDSQLSFKVGEEDVNWAVNAYDRQKALFNQNMLLQYMPFILLAFVSMVIMIIFIYFFRNFEVLKDMALLMKESAESIAQAKAGTVVLG